MTYHYQELLHCGSDNAPAINTSILNQIIERGQNICLPLGQQGSGGIHVAVKKFAVNYDSYRKPGAETEEVFDIAIMSVGRGGANWLTQQAFYKELDIYPGQVDIGVRVETSCFFTEEVGQTTSMSLNYTTRTHRHNDVVRNFCSNPKGICHARKNHREYVLINGHSKMFEKSEKQQLRSARVQDFYAPFQESADVFAKNIAKIVNMLAGGGGPLVPAAHW